MQTLITKVGPSFVGKPAPELNQQYKANGWKWLSFRNEWVAIDPRRVAPLLDYCDDTARDFIEGWQGKRKEAVAASIAIDAEIEIPAPPGLAYRPYQKAGIAFMRARKVSLNADSMRLGKTVQTLGVINTYDRPLKVLVICPANAKVNWTREADKWLLHKETVGYAEGNNLPDARFTVINFTILSRHVEKLRSVQWDVIVVDEAHFLGNPDSQRTKATLSLTADLHFIFLTGTPIYTRPSQLFPMLQRLDPNGLGANKWRYLRRYCDAKKDDATGRWSFDGYSNEEELQHLMRSRFMIRREKHDVVDEIPTNRQTITLPQEGLVRLIEKEKSLFQQKFDDMVAGLKEGLSDDQLKALAAFDRATTDLDVIDETEPVASIRRQLAIAKIPMCLDFIEEQLLTDDKVVVFAHHREVVKSLHQQLSKYNPAIVIGGMSTAKRQEAIDRFRDDPECRVFVGNITAAGSAISLAASDCAIFCELSWVPSEIDQAEERIWDPTKTVGVTIYRLVLEDSLESQLAHVLEKRQENIERMMVAKYLKH